MKSLADLWSLSKELAQIKRMIPEIKPVSEYFDKSENPRESLEKILDFVEKNPVTDDLLKISQTYDMILRAEKNACEKGWNYACLEAVKEMGIKVKLIGEEHVPKGPALYVSNHPYGLLDSAILIGSLGSLLNKKGEKLKAIAMNQLKFIKGIEEVLIFMHSTSPGSNLGPLKDSLKYLENGGNLAFYPSRRMSGPRLKEYSWNDGIARFISHSSYVVPMWFSGPNHEGLYNLLARNEKTEKLKRLVFLRGVWNKRGKKITLNIGEPIYSGKLMDIKDNEEKIQYLRKSAEILKV